MLIARFDPAIKFETEVHDMIENDAAAAARARGQALRGARAARARKIRRRIVSGSLALFVAAWLLIAIVLVSGHDPALARKASTTSSATTVASTPATTTSSGGTSTTSSGDTSTTSSGDTSTTSRSGSRASTTSSSSSSSGSGASSVTTSQS